MYIEKLKKNLIYLLMCCIVTLAGCNGSHNSSGTTDELTISKSTSGGELKSLVVMAGSGVKSLLDPVNIEFKKKTGIQVNAQYLCSAMVLSNLLLTRDCDVFFPGSEYFMDLAVEKGAVDKTTKKDGCYMIPVIVTPKGNPKNIKTLEDMTKPGVRIAIAETETVSIGRLAKKMFQDLKLWESLQKNIVNVPASATKVMIVIGLNHVDASINWKPTVMQFLETADYVDIPATQIKYSVAPCGIATWADDRKSQKIAQEYIDFIMSPEVQQIAMQWGYFLPEEAKKAERIP
jgi:molybdate transport system substrate-binding protein